MANPNPLPSFSDFPEDVQLCILSFLTPNDIATFACTSKRFLSLCNSDSRLWFAMCDRKWGSKTQIREWVKSGAVTYKKVYRTLSEWENLIGFWRRSGQGSAAISSPSLLFFEWGDSFVSGFRVSPSSKRGSYEVVKAPFLWMGLSGDGQVVNFLDPDGRSEFSPLPEFGANGEVGFEENDLVPVNVSFMGSTHFVLEENQSFVAAGSSSCSYDQRKNGFRGSSSANGSGDECGGVGEDVSGSPGSLPDRLMSEIYQHLANRTSPGSDKSRKQRRRREKERLARRKWEPEHFVKIVNFSPTLSRPLQGLWKGICEDMSLAFYLVAYDDIGGIACRRVGDPPEPLSSYAPIFWTSKATFLESPFSLEEETLYGSRLHLGPLLQLDDEIQEPFPMSDDELIDRVQEFNLSDNEAVKRILHISSSYDLVIPDMAGAINRRSAEGRIWQYQNGTFGFGFLRDNFVIDMKHIVHDGCLVDTVNP